MSEPPRRSLFQEEEIKAREIPPPVVAIPKGAPRVQKANRSQLELRPFHLEAILPEDHTARTVWEMVNRLDLTALYDEILATEGHVGRAAIDPVILMSLWMYATIDGVGSARALARLCDAYDAYRWICGGVLVNDHTLADFRVDHGKFLDDQLTARVASLMAEGLVELNKVARDGMRVRASAGAASFCRKATLDECLKDARKQIDDLKKEVNEDPDGTNRRRRDAGSVPLAKERSASGRH